MLGRTVALVGVMAIASLLALPAPVGAADSGAEETYIVLYKQHSVGSDAAAVVQRAGGELVHAYDAIGVVIARSSDPSFRENILREGRVGGAAATTNFGLKIDDGTSV